METWPAIPFTDYIQNMKKVCVRGTNLKIIAAASLFQIEIYLAAETYNIGDPQWLLYPPNPCLSCLTGTSKNILSTSLSLPTHWYTTSTLKLLSTMLSPSTHTYRYTMSSLKLWYNYAYLKVLLLYQSVACDVVSSPDPQLGRSTEALGTRLLMTLSLHTYVLRQCKSIRGRQRVKHCVRRAGVSRYIVGFLWIHGPGKYIHK